MDLGIWNQGCANNIRFRLQPIYQNVIWLKTVSNVKRLPGPEPTASTMKEEQPAILALLDGCLTQIL